MKLWIIADHNYPGHQNSGLVSFDPVGLRQEGAKTLQRAMEKKRERKREKKENRRIKGRTDEQMFRLIFCILGYVFDQIFMVLHFL